MRKLLNVSVVCGAVILLTVGGSPVAAQEPVPIPGVTGTVASEQTVDEEYGAAHEVIVKTREGLAHLAHFTNVLFHGGKNGGTDPLRGLAEGTNVVVHYTQSPRSEEIAEPVSWDENGLPFTEGTIVDVRRGRGLITIRFENRRTETFQLSEAAAADRARGREAVVLPAQGVMVSYTDELGQSTERAFRKTS